MVARVCVVVAMLLCSAQTHAWRLGNQYQPPGEPEAHASGIFLNQSGDVLTARHAVEGCTRLFVMKDGRVAEARVVAMSRDVDAAVLATSLRPPLIATFPLRTEPYAAPLPVFAEGYSALRAMEDRHLALFNAVMMPGREKFSMMSPVRPGASGSPVLSANGHVLAMVVERTARVASGFNTRALSRQQSFPVAPVGASEVAGVSSASIRQFLGRHGVRFRESAEAQLGPGQPAGPRALTLSAGVICEK